MRSLLAGLVAAALALCGCAASVVHGRGVDLVTSTSTTTDFPTSTSTASSPSTVPPLAPPPSSSSGGTVVTNTAGHYRVLMPGTPTRSSQPGGFGGVTFTVHIDQLHDPVVEVIASEDISIDLPSDQYEATLTEAVSSFESSSGATEVSVQDTTFRGKQARQAEVTEAGASYTFLAVIWQPNRLYLMFAPAGAAFDALSSSFVALP